MTRALKIFLAGDVMTGRGVDQILPRPCDHRLHEPWVADARDYVTLAKERSGPIPAARDLAYPWGDALAELARVAPDARIVNLETAITRSDRFDGGKDVHYRMSPENAPCLAAAKLDVCALANNHVLDWGAAGLADTVATLDRLSIAHAGAGKDLDAAQAPGVVDLGGGRRLLVFSLALASSGVPARWAAGRAQPGVWLVPDGTTPTLRGIAEAVARWRRPGDLAIASIHWGSNWGHPISVEEARLARDLVERLGFALVHGHSSHHVRAVGVLGGRLVLFGCGDLLTDYEGIRGHETFRGDLGLMYFAELDGDGGALRRLEMTPTRMRRLRITRVTGNDAAWLRDVLRREGARLGTSVELDADGRLWLRRG